MKKYYQLSVFTALLVVSSLAYAQCPTLVWSDEFDGTALDLNKWEPMVGDGCNYGICGWGNNELQYYKAENAVVSNGSLKIIAKKERVKGKQYTSARLRTKSLADFTFGRFEARIKLLEGQGLWPAFWMLSTNEPYGGWPQSGEIDIMELLGQDPEVVHGTIHYGDAYPNNQHKGQSYHLYNNTKFSDSFHVFALEWEPGILRWYVDDVLYQTIYAEDVYNWPFDAGNQMHFLLNVAVGGNWPGNPDATTVFPSQMEVDYVRVYDGGFHPSISGARLVAYQAAGETYTINNAPNGSSFSWAVPPGATIVSGQGTSTVTVDWGDTSGLVVCDVTTNCVSRSYEIEVTVEPPYNYEFSFENFDQQENVSLISTTGSLSEVANPNTSGVNTSALAAEYVRNSQEQYDVIAYQTSAISDASAYSNRDKKFYMDVLTQAPVGTEIIIQLESSADATSTNYPTGRHSRYVGKISQNGVWERIVFDYLDAPDGSTPGTGVDQIIILFASNSFTGDTYYWDNLDSYSVGTSSGTNNPPVASFSYSSSNLTVSFDGSGSSDSDGSIAAWSWDFGDGNMASGTLVNHTYAAAGSYNVSLTVTDNDGATDVSSAVISVTDGTGATSMHVESIVTGTASAGQGKKNGTATVTIHDELENPVNGATVTGTFTGSFNETVSGQTGADGVVTLVTSASAKGSLVVDFCVDDVMSPDLAYDAAGNTLTCTSSGARKSNLINQQSLMVQVYPNPFTNGVTIEGPVGEIESWTIYNISGKSVLDSERVGTGKDNSRIPIDLSHLKKGIYYLRINFGTHQKSLALIKR